MAEKRTLRQLKVRTSPLSVSFSLIERDAVQDAAETEGESVSAFIRDAAVKRAARVNAKATQQRAA